MELKQYQSEVKRTLPDLKASELNIAHMIYGLNSEFDEILNAVDNANLNEEAGDLLWYASNYCNIKNIDIWRVFSFSKDYYRVLPNDDYIIQLQVEISKLTDIEKKVLAYKRETSYETFLNAITSVYERLNDCYVYYNMDPLDSMQKNIDKLRKRYPDKFSAYHANNRDLVGEREILEGVKPLNDSFINRVTEILKKETQANGAEEVK